MRARVSSCNLSQSLYFLVPFSLNQLTEYAWERLYLGVPVSEKRKPRLCTEIETRFNYMGSDSHWFDWSYCAIYSVDEACVKHGGYIFIGFYVELLPC